MRREHAIAGGKVCEEDVLNCAGQSARRQVREDAVDLHGCYIPLNA
jgi:hypothetical protein